MQIDHPLLHRLCLLLASTGYVVAVLVLFVFASFRLSLSLYTGDTQQESIWTISAAEAKAPQPLPNRPTGAPVRISIPKIQVQSIINKIGLLQDGSMGAPKLPNETAWYMHGPKPGATGSAVIAGHMNWWYGAKGIFENLKNLKKGDVVAVQNDAGVMKLFIVRSTRVFGQNEDTSSVFRSYDGKAHLNLVTCSGTWNKYTQSYAKRLVVFADLIE